MLPTAHISCFPEKFNILAVFTYGFLLSDRRSREQYWRTVPSRHRGPAALPVPHTVPLQSCLWVSLLGHLPRGQAQRDASLPCRPQGTHPWWLQPLGPVCSNKSHQSCLPLLWRPGSHRSPCPGTTGKLSQGPAPPQSDFSLSRNLELVHLIPAQYLAV